MEVGVQDLTAAFEKLLAKSEEGKYVFRLYVTGNTPQSARAIANLTRLCEDRLAGRYEIAVVDLYQSPEEAEGQQIIAAPTLVKELPLPLRRLVGDLSNRNRVLLALDINPEDE